MGHFDRAPVETFSEIVHRVSKGTYLRAQVADESKPGTLMRGLNAVGEPMKYAPKFVSKINTVTQTYNFDNVPGAGMLEVVESSGQTFVPTPAAIREATLLVPDGF